MTRLVPLLNPRFQGPPVHPRGHRPAAPFALYLREFRAERNQQLNALNARWGKDPYEHRVGRVLRRRRLRLLGLVDPSRPEPPLFLQEAVAVANDRWEAEVRRLVPAAQVVLLDLRKHSMGHSDPVTGSIQRELAIIRRSGADRRTIALGRRGLSSVAATVWHLQPLSLTALDIAFGCIVGVVAYLLPVGGAALAVGYVAGRLHLASGAFLLAWRRRFRSLVDGVLAGDASRVGNRRRTAAFERPTAGGAGRG